MVLKRMLGGIGLAMAMLLLVMAAMVAWFYLPLDVNLDFSKLNFIVLLLMPFVAGGYVGAALGKEGMKYGFFTGFILWVLVMALFWWLLPQLMNYQVLLVTLAGSAFLGAAGGLCGVNMRNIRRVLRQGPVKPEEGQPPRAKKAKRTFHGRRRQTIDWKTAAQQTTVPK